MTNALEYWGRRNNFVELYEVVKVAVINKNDRLYRIEVLKGYRNPAIPFSTRCDVKNESGVWESFDLPWTARDDADSALSQALSFLANAEAIGVGR